MPDPIREPSPNALPQSSPAGVTSQQPASSPSAATPPSPSPTEFHIGDEFGTAKRNLPPARILVISVAIVAIIVAIVAFHERPQPQGDGSINLVSAVEVPGQNMVLAAITLTLRNSAQKPLWIRSLKAQLTSADGHPYEDRAASAVDFDRYYQAFPTLKEGSEPAIPPETKLLPGTEKRGTIMVGFPVTKEAFDQRKALVVIIQPYDQPLPITLK